MSETRNDRGKVAVEGLQELTNALSNGTTPTPTASCSQDWGSEPTQNSNRYYFRND